MRASSLIVPSSCGVAIPLRDDRVGLDQRIVVGVVLEKELDDARDEDRAARDAGLRLARTNPPRRRA